MKKRANDWKEIAESYYEKSFSVAILLILLSVLGFPKLEVKPFQKEIKYLESIYMPNVEPEPIAPPTDPVRPQIDIDIEFEELSGNEDIEIIDTIPPTRLEDWVPPTTSQSKITKYNNFQDPPIALKQIAPIYPKWAKMANIEGFVEVEVEILADGRVNEVNVLQSVMESPNDFDKAVIDAINLWEFQPAKSNGKAVPCWVKLRFDFQVK
jgi:protein TonB